MDTPNYPMPMKENNPSTYLIAGVALLLAGAIIGVFTAPYLPFSGSATTSYQAGFDAAKKLVQNSSVGNFFATPDEVRSLSGTVTSISGDSLALHIRSVNPFDDPALADRTVLLNASTTVVKLTAKDPAVFQSELSSFTKAVQTKTVGANAIPSPSPFTSVTVSASSISVGDTINVISSSNVKTLKEFTARGIQIQPKASPLL